MDTVAFATIVAGSETDADALFKIESVLKGDALLKVGQEIRVNYFGKAKEGQHFLIMGVDPPDLLWSSPLPVSDLALDYIRAIPALPEASVERLNFYLKYLEHEESLLARDAYDEFASAPYPELKQLKDSLNRPQLLEWIKDTGLPPDRKRLYLVMLGIAGEPADADLLEGMLRSDDANQRAGLDAMIACYATLKGADGLKLIDELFLSNKKSQYADTYAAIMALRFHGTDGGVLPKKRVLESMRLILDRPELADLVIPDLARWEDWTQVDRMVNLFKSADDKSSWVRVPVINYLRACPLPEAAKELEALKELDPAAFKRATSFFPIPRPAAETKDSSSTLNSARVQGIASTSRPRLRVSQSPTLLAFNGKSAVGTDSARALVAVPPVALTTSANRLLPACVLTLVSTTLGLSMWLMLSGAGRHGALELCRVSVRS
ncbi:hypothetical protein Q31a_59100 [Aureliella helgolandensis]|uniref:Uncharacterized protein n=2 Tax=Aureliella helgolandensis TaxID=2527968 RepID=A0A518GFZ4_9BACT|nr:hypothetical protein Q31a_59100 [Aureliella helgolandensis]